MTTTPATQSLLPVTQEARDAAAGIAEDLAINSDMFAPLIRNGEHDRHPFVQAFAIFERDILERQAHSLPGDVGMRENDKPPAHWQPDDRYADRQPQTPEEWDWRADGPDTGALSRSIKRLNYGAGRADPHAPDQMATVLRIDVMRVTSQLVWLTAKTEMYGKILAERNALRDATKDVIATADDYYTARNGRRCSIEGEDGEKCWIVPFDPFEALRAALTPSALSGDAGEVADRQPIGYGRLLPHRGTEAATSSP